MYLLPISRNETFSPAPKLFVSLFLLPCKDNHCPDFWSNFLNVFTMDISVQFSCSVMSDSLQPHEPQHARPPCTSPTPRVHPNPCPLSRWYHPTIPSSAVPFSSWPHLSQQTRPFPMSWLFPSVAKVLELQLQHQSFQQIFRFDFL